MDALMQNFRSVYNDPALTYNHPDFRTVMTNYLNLHTGNNLTFMDYAEYITSCGLNDIYNRTVTSCDLYLVFNTNEFVLSP